MQKDAKILRMIDVNINRATEGLRVIEDILRLVIENRRLTEKLKHHRAAIKDIIRFLPLSRQELLASRRAGDDIGKDMYTASEASRGSVTQIITSNFKRSEEALRVLEECSKLLEPKAGKKFKDIRFDLYELEKKTLELSQKIDSSRYKNSKLDFDLYGISDNSVLFGRSHIEVVKKLISSGIKIIQLRDKEIGKGKYLCLAKKVRELTNRAGVVFIVNDHVDIAKIVDADGVHLGRDDIGVKEARKILGEDKIIGLSAYSMSQAVEAQRQGADYIGFGPIFRTPIKAKKPPVGLKRLKAINTKVRVPVVAIGGIDASNIYNVWKTGVHRAAVIRAIVGQKDINSAVKRLRKAIRSVK